MHAFRKLTVVGALAALGACGSDQLAAPDLDTTLDPTVVETRTSDIETVYGHPAMASLFAMSDYGAPLSVNTLLQRTGTRLRSHKAIVSGTGRRPARPAFAVAAYEPAIPAEARGSVFVFDDVEGYWVLDDSRDGPADGVRFMLRGLDDAGGLTDVEIGSVEVRDLTTEAQYRLITTIRAGALTVLSFEERVSGDEAVDLSYSYAGYITDGTHRVDLSDVYTERESGDSYRAVEDFGWTLRSGASARAHWVWNGATATDKDWVEVKFDGNSFRFVTPYVWYDEWSMYDAGDVTNMYGNGHLLAVITWDELSESATFETPAGEPLDASQVEGILNLQYVVESIAELIWLPAQILESLVGNIGAPAVL